MFLELNFAALTIGGLFTCNGVPSNWYAGIAKAPWTPPGWVFGTAWTTIMICFGVYMAYLWPVIENKKILIGLYAVQWILNVGWNPIRMRTDDRFDGVSYRYEFTTEFNTWMIIDIPFHKCVPVFRGRILEDVEPILPEEIHQIGFLISNKQTGKFQLEIDWIKAYNK
jgi:hypothetical protein